MGRKSKHPSGTRHVNVRLPAEDVDWLSMMAPTHEGGITGIIHSCIVAFRERVDPSSVEAAKQALIKERLDLKEQSQREDLRLEREIAKCDAKLAALDHSRDELTDRRIEMLTRAMRAGCLFNYSNFQGWATGPANEKDLSACFEYDCQKAFEWMTNDPEALAWRQDHDPRVLQLQKGLQ